MTEVAKHLAVPQSGVRVPSGGPANDDQASTGSGALPFADLLDERAGSNKSQSSTSNAGPDALEYDTPPTGVLPADPTNRAAYIPPQTVAALFGEDFIGPRHVADIEPGQDKPIPVPIAETGGVILDGGPAEVHVHIDGVETRLARRADAFENTGVFGRELFQTHARGGDNPTHGGRPANNSAQEFWAMDGLGRLALPTDTLDPAMILARSSSHLTAATSIRSRPIPGNVVATPETAGPGINLPAVSVADTGASAAASQRQAAALKANAAAPILDPQRLELALARLQNQSVQLSVQVMAGRVKIIARVGDMSSGDQAKLRADIKAMVGRHGHVASEIEIVAGSPGTGGQSRGER